MWTEMTGFLVQSDYPEEVGQSFNSAVIHRSRAGPPICADKPRVYQALPDTFLEGCRGHDGTEGHLRHVG